MLDNEQEHAVDTFENIINEMVSFNVTIPNIDELISFNEGTILIRMFDKFFAIFEEMTVENTDEKQLMPVALGSYERNNDIRLIDFRYLGDIELFQKGLEQFMSMIKENKIEDKPFELTDSEDNLSYDEIVTKLVTKYSMIKPVIIH